MPIAAGEAYHRVVDRRASLGTPPPSGPRPDPLAAFASLINAKPSEVSFIPNTSTGENLVVECLGIRRNAGNVVTDALHFEGALIHLYELQRQGLDRRVVMPRDNRIELRDLERVIDRTTTLVAVSLVSMYKGFQHDLDSKGIAKNAREEKLRARKAQHENEKMAELYRQHVLKEAPKQPVIQIQGLKKSQPVA